MDDFKDAAASPRASEPQRPGKSSSMKHEHDSSRTGAPAPVQSSDLLNYILRFLSTSSNEVLLGVFACSMVATYVLLGRLGLVLIGTVLGVIIHASWEGWSNEHPGHETGIPTARRREVTLHLANRLLDWPKRKTPEVLDSKVAREPTMDLDYSIFRPKTAAALKSLTDSIVRDYVK